jgi:hypothetical protein
MVLDEPGLPIDFNPTLPYASNHQDSFLFLAQNYERKAIKQYG